MRRLLPALSCLTVFLALLGLSACLAGAEPLPPEDTQTLPPPTQTPTPTTVWFPPTPTFTPRPSPTGPVTPTLEASPSHGELLFHDDFSDPDLWSLGRTAAGSAALGKHELTVAVSQERGYVYSLRRGELSDFYAEVTASPSLCRGEDEYGLLLRVSKDDFFRFSISCSGQVRLDRFLKGKASSPQPWMMHGAIPPGAPSFSRLAVWARGREMRFYANDQFLFSVSDGSLPSGNLGLFARSANDTPVTVNFSDLQVFRIQ